MYVIACIGVVCTRWHTIGGVSDHVNCVLYSPTQPHVLSAADNGIIKVCIYIQFALSKSPMVIRQASTVHICTLASSPDILLIVQCAQTL